MELLIIFSSIVLTTYFFLKFNYISDNKKKTLFTTELIFKYDSRIALTIFDEENEDKVIITGEHGVMKRYDKNNRTFYFEFDLSKDNTTLEYWVFVVSEDKQIFSERLVAKLKDSWGNNMLDKPETNDY